MKHRILGAALCGALCLTAAEPALAVAKVTAYAGSQTLLLGGQSVSPNGDAFWNGGEWAPVSLVYQGRLYVAVRWAASLARLGIHWSRKQQTVSLSGSRAVVHKPSTARAFSGALAVQTRRVGLTVRGRSWTPAGRLLALGGQKLPDALYTRLTMYMPASLLSTALNLPMTWPQHKTPSGMYTTIQLPVARLQPGSVLAVSASVGGVPASDPLGYTWTMRGPDGNLVPLLGGDSASSEQIPFGTSAAHGTYTIMVTVTDGRSGGRASASADIHITGTPPASLKAPAFGYPPQTIARAYDIYNTWLGGDFGQGQAIVLYEPQGFSMQDVSTFDDVFGLPAPSIRVKSSGGSFPPSLEATMDVEWAHALAPLAQLIVVEDDASGSSAAFPPSLAQGLQSQALNGGEIASDSWGVLPSAASDAGADQVLAALTSGGFSLFAAGGDNLGLSGPPPLYWPAVNPNVVAVGGTSLIERTPANYFESYWDQPDASSSFGAAPYAATYWQKQVTGLAQRQVPDVAFDANPSTQTGVDVYFDGSWLVEGGTSLGAPSWAAIWSLCRTAVPDVPTAQRALYAVASSRYDAGALHNPNNEIYDPRTGIGYPDVANLISALRALY